MSTLSLHGQVPPSAPAEERYRPESPPRRHGIGLCLSGGGYRAALFHLGALRRLNELDVLRQLRTVSSVSGGSIAAAHLATVLVRHGPALPWPGAGPIPAATWDERVARPLRLFTSRNIRTPALARRLLPWNWGRDDAGVEHLAQTYERELSPLRLTELPAVPDFILCATDMAYGVNWIMTRARMGDWRAGYVRNPGWSVGRAVAASACFPPIFNPMRVGLDPRDLTEGDDASPARDAAVRGLRLTDGGLYDNLALEPVWKNHAVVLVSDAGGLFASAPDEGLPARLHRYQAIQEAQTRALRKRWLISSFLAAEEPGTTGAEGIRGAYWSVGSSRGRFLPGDTLGYSPGIVAGWIGGIRTDLDAFSAAEAEILENHGYAMADAAVKRHVPSIVTDAPFAPPHPAWPPAAEAAVREALRDSARLRLLGRW